MVKGHTEIRIKRVYDPPDEAIEMCAGARHASILAGSACRAMTDALKIEESYQMYAGASPQRRIV
jgi:hypothetical protein